MVIYEIQCDKRPRSVKSEINIVWVIVPSVTSSISENARVLFDGSQASFHHGTTKNIDLYCPITKIWSEQCFFVNSHGGRITLQRA